MKFLIRAVQHAKESQNSLIELLRKNLSKPVEPRSYEVIHASDLTKEFFCPRKVALMDLTKTKHKSELRSIALSATFDLGSIIADLAREKWLGGDVIGDWFCLKCEKTLLWSKQPDKFTGVVDGCMHHWKYKEIVLVSEKYGFQGSVDALVDLGDEKVWIVELKIMAAEQFAELVAPLAEHRIRTNLYMMLAEGLVPERIRTDVAKILYISRGYGKKHHSGEILPFKEFNVTRNDSELNLALWRAKQIRAYKQEGVLPQKVCDTSWCKEAKKCPVVTQCFSGKYH